jgi:hypothetical protein
VPGVKRTATNPSGGPTRRNSTKPTGDGSNGLGIRYLLPFSVAESSLASEERPVRRKKHLRSHLKKKKKRVKKPYSGGEHEKTWKTRLSHGRDKNTCDSAWRGALTPIRAIEKIYILLEARNEMYWLRKKKNASRRRSGYKWVVER